MGLNEYICCTPLCAGVYLGTGDTVVEKTDKDCALLETAF